MVETRFGTEMEASEGKLGVGAEEEELVGVMHLSPEMLDQRRSLCLRCLKHW